MGNYCCSQNIINYLLNNFLNSNIIDDEYKIIIGTYIETNKINNLYSNTMISQGICVGYNRHVVINKLKFGIFHSCENKTVELYFENNIKLLLIKDNINSDVKLILTSNNKTIEKYMNRKIIRNIKLINNNSDDIDLILKLFN